MLFRSALFLALAFPALAPATGAEPMPPHPEIRAALNSLEHAKAHLQEARHDFGGHRVEAIRAIDEAAHQLTICLDYDK